MADYFLANRATVRANSTAYAVGDRVVLARNDTQTNYLVMRRYVYECMVAGTSGASVPAYIASADVNFADGGVTWMCRECTSWDNANLYPDYISTRMAPGDRLLVSHLYVGTASLTTFNVNFPGTFAEPNQFLCVNEGTGLPATTAVFNYVGDTKFYLNGCVYGYGMEFNIGSNVTAAAMGFGAVSGNVVQEWDTCTFHLGTAAGSQQWITIGTTQPGSRKITWTNCNAKFSGAGGSIGIGGASLVWNGGKFLPGVDAAVTVFNTARSTTYSGEVLARGVDFSDLHAASNIFNGAGQADGAIYNCRLPNGWIGALASEITNAAARYSMHNSDNADTHYRFFEDTIVGSTSLVTSAYKIGGGELDGMPFSIYVGCGNLYTNYSTGRIRVTLPPVWCEAGVPVTLTYSVAHNKPADAFTNKEVWLEVMYPSSPTSPLTTLITTVAPVIGATTPHPVGGSTWAGLNGTFYRWDHELTASFTPQNTGWAEPQVVVASGGLIVYVDPEAQVT